MESTTKMARSASALLLLVALCSCASARPCDPRLQAAAGEVASWEWMGIDQAELLRRAPVDTIRLDQMQSPSMEPCSGLLMIRSLNRVIDGVCECCLTFEFARHINERGDCVERLEGIVYETVEGSQQAARDQVEEIYTKLQVPPAAMGHAVAAGLFEDGASHEWAVGATVHSVTARARRVRTGEWAVSVALRRLSPD